MPFDTEYAELFVCTQCGECCKGFGGTYVTEADLLAIAGYVGLSLDTVKSDYCVFSGSRRVLAQRKDGYCVFWDGNCTIHPVKPRMCRQWPFIASLGVDIANWHIMASCCPGMRRDMDDAALHARLRKLLPPC